MMNYTISSPEVHKSPFLSQTALDSAKWPTVQILVKNVLTFFANKFTRISFTMYTCFMKDKRPQIIQHDRNCVQEFFFYNAKALNLIWYLNSNFPDQIEKECSTIDLKTKSWSVLFQLHFPQIWNITLPLRLQISSKIWLIFSFSMFIQLVESEDNKSILHWRRCHHCTDRLLRQRRSSSGK